MSVCQMISTYHDNLLRKLAERYQAPLGNHNISIYPEWQAFLSLTFVQGILHNGRAVYPFTPPPPPNQKVLVSPLITMYNFKTTSRTDIDEVLENATDLQCDERHRVFQRKYDPVTNNSKLRYLRLLFILRVTIC